MDVDPYAPLVEQAAWIETGAMTSVDLVRASLHRIATLDPRLNAFHHVLANEALAEAADRDAGPRRGPLHGVPIAVKEENDVAGLPTALGGRAVERPAAADGEVVRRLRAAGAVIVGTTRMPECGIWPFTESDAGGITRNPWNPDWSTAGSSGGSAAAVAAGMVAAAIGGDGGGSIRLPASWCGLYGLKPQRGRVSTAPHPDLWRSLGTIGPLTRTVADSAAVYDAISGSTVIDRWSAPPVLLTPAVDAPFTPLRIAVTTRCPAGPIKPDDRSVDAVHRTASTLRSLGHRVEEVRPHYPVVTLPFLSQLVAGVADEQAEVDHPDRLERRTRHLLTVGRPLGRRAARGQAAGLRAATAFNDHFFARFDLLLTLTTPTPTVSAGRIHGRGLVRTALAALPVASYTSLWNVLGNPAAAIPAGLTDDGRPLSVQLVGPPDGDALVVTVSAQLEQAQPWRHLVPPLTGVA